MKVLIVFCSDMVLALDRTKRLAADVKASLSPNLESELLESVPIGWHHTLVASMP